MYGTFLETRSIISKSLDLMSYVEEFTHPAKDLRVLLVKKTKRNYRKIKRENTYLQTLIIRLWT